MEYAMQASDRKKSAYQYLIVAMLASMTASICCIGPFALLATGISGAWMSQLMIVEPFQPLLMALTVLLLALAGWKLFYSAAKNEQGNSCPAQKSGRQQKLAYFLTGGLALILLTSEYWILWVAG